MSSIPETTTDSTIENATTPDAPAAPTARDRAKPVREGKDIHLTELAAQQIKQIIEKDDYPDSMYMYVGVKGGGCSGLSYVLDLRDETHAPIGETDEVFESQGVFIVCDLKSYVVGNLTGTVIDYKESMMGAGFTFENPNAKHTCGCGSSYSA